MTKSKKRRRISIRRATPTQFFAYSIIAIVSFNVIHSAGIRDPYLPNDPHTSHILSPCQMTDVPHLFDIVWTDQGGLQTMKTYLNQDGDPNLIESTGQKRSLLEMFAYAGHETFVDTLLTKSASVSYVDADGHNAFYQASVAGQLPILTRLITYVRSNWSRYDLPVLINAQDRRQLRALHIGSGNGYERITDILLRQGAQVDLVEDKVEIPTEPASSLFEPFSDVIFRELFPDKPNGSNASNNFSTGISDDTGRRALHLPCSMRHEGIVGQSLQGFNATVSIKASKGLTEKDFFKLGEFSEDLQRSRVIEAMLSDAERRLSLLCEENKAGQREQFRRDENLNEFMTAFQRKRGSVFLAYRALELDSPFKVRKKYLGYRI